MKVKWWVAGKTDQGGGALIAGIVALAAAATPLLAPGTAYAAAPGGGTGPAGKKIHAVKLEAIPGSPAKQVTLTAKAAERLGIETGKVSEEIIIRKQMVGGLVIASSQVRQPGAQPADRGFGGFGQPVPAPAIQRIAAGPQGPAVNEAWVLVTLSPVEWERLAKDKPARLLPLATRDPLAKEVLARPSGMTPFEDTKRSMLSLYYVVSGKDHGLEPNKRMRVELQLDGSNEKHKAVPYSAVYYDAKGTPWVYLNTQPLVFQRQRVAIARIAGDFAVLTEGPPVGTPVVTVGAPLLYGAEIFGK